MTGPLPVACPFCPRAFDNANSLRQHLYSKRRVADSHRRIAGSYITRDDIRTITAKQMTRADVIDLVQAREPGRQ